MAVLSIRFSEVNFAVIVEQEAMLKAISMTFKISIQIAYFFSDGLILEIVCCKICVSSCVAVVLLYHVWLSLHIFVTQFLGWFAETACCMWCTTRDLRSATQFHYYSLTATLMHVLNNCRCDCCTTPYLTHKISWGERRAAVDLTCFFVQQVIDPSRSDSWPYSLLYGPASLVMLCTGPLITVYRLRTVACYVTPRSIQHSSQFL